MSDEAIAIRRRQAIGEQIIDTSVGQLTAKRIREIFRTDARFPDASARSICTHKMASTDRTAIWNDLEFDRRVMGERTSFSHNGRFVLALSFDRLYFHILLEDCWTTGKVNTLVAPTDGQRGAHTQIQFK